MCLEAVHESHNLTVNISLIKIAIHITLKYTHGQVRKIRQEEKVIIVKQKVSTVLI